MGVRKVRIGTEFCSQGNQKVLDIGVDVLECLWATVEVGGDGAGNLDDGVETRSGVELRRQVGGGQSGSSRVERRHGRQFVGSALRRRGCFGPNVAKPLARAFEEWPKLLESLPPLFSGSINRG